MRMRIFTSGDSEREATVGGQGTPPGAYCLPEPAPAVPGACKLQASRPRPRVVADDRRVLRLPISSPAPAVAVPAPRKHAIAANDRAIHPTAPAVRRHLLFLGVFFRSASLHLLLCCPARSRQMLRSLVPRLFAPARSARLYSTQPAVTAPAAGPSSQSVSPPPARGPEGAVALPYRVPRNSNGSVPVYTDIRNGGTRYLVLIRNVQGSVDALAKDLKSSLFPPGSDEAARLKVSTTHSRHVTLSGGRWKNQVHRWLASRGF